MRSVSTTSTFCSTCKHKHTQTHTELTARNRASSKKTIEEEKEKANIRGADLTSARETLVSFLRSVLALFKAFLLLNTGTLIMGVLILELATIRISLSLWDRRQERCSDSTQVQNTDLKLSEMGTQSLTSECNTWLTVQVNVDLCGVETVPVDMPHYILCGFPARNHSGLMLSKHPKSTVTSWSTQTICIFAVA